MREGVHASHKLVACLALGQCGGGAPFLFLQPVWLLRHFAPGPAGAAVSRGGQRQRAARGAAAALPVHPVDRWPLVGLGEAAPVAAAVAA